MAVFQTNGIVQRELLIPQTEILALLQREFGIPEGAEVEAAACDIQGDKVVSRLGPRINLMRHGLVVKWTET